VIATPPPPTPVEGMAIVEPKIAPAKIGLRVPRAEVVHDSPRASVGAIAAPRIKRVAGMVVMLVLASVSAIGLRARALATPLPLPPLRVAPQLVTATLRLEGALVRGAERGWAAKHTGRLRYGDPVPVQMTAYCLKGTTRRDSYVRQGIIAADPRIFPLGRYVELYVGRVYYGRFLVDDTGAAIHDAIVDIWTPTCRDARLFGRHVGTAVLVPRPRGASRDTLMTGRLGGVASR
jgi:3D (Asp-Asp-Asp) domain-containing protein